MNEGRLGVLVMSYGTPRSAQDVESYYTHVRRGRPPTDEQLADLRRRYEAIGGISPLAQRTAAQTAAIAEALGPEVVVAHGAKHASPFVEDAVGSLAESGVDRIVGIVLAPHFSALSIGEYETRASEAAARAGTPYEQVRSWHLAAPLVAALAERVSELLPADLLLVTAHSLPERVLAMGDPYPDQLAETGAAIVSALGGSAPAWRTAWQSAGRTPEPWIGPDILDVIRGLPEEGVSSVVVCPAGFTADHLEVLFDIDIEAQAVATEVGVQLNRTRSLNDDHGLVAAMVDAIRAAGATDLGRP